MANNNLEIKQCILVNNDCYKKGRKMKPSGIVVHSTGANNPSLSRYIQPNDGILGINKYNNHWNKSGVNKCVHAFIGKDKDGKVRIYQTLPWNYRCWGCGSGKKGSYNSSYIQFEVCEDLLTDEDYFNRAFDLAIKLCIYLSKKYNFSVSNIVSHREAHDLGYASNHGDCDHWLKKFGKDMSWFRWQVSNRIGSIITNITTSVPLSSTTSFKVKLKDDMTIRNTPEVKSDNIVIKDGAKKGVIYTIVETNGNWGLLKSYQKNRNGWICISDKYAQRV